MIEIRADRAGESKPLTPFWNFCVGAGRANEGLRARWQDQLRRAVKECGFRHIRFHGLFHDDMFVYREEQGQAVYNFQYVDDLFDALLEIGIKPFVEFGFCPGDLASEKATVFWWKANGAPPNDYGKWAELVSRSVQHWISRYGIDEVRTWYFEVWNEPNLHPFFKGTRSQYFELYKVTALAVKAIDPQLRVGGPATSNFVPDARFDGETEDFQQHAGTIDASDLDVLNWQPVWLVQFLDYCTREKLPVDFVSAHPYPTDWALDSLGETRKLTRGVDATPTDLATIRKLVNASSFSHAEIHLTEWSSSPSPRDYTHDYLQAATFIVRANLESIGLVDSLSYWTFTDVFEEGGAGDSAFHGGFGMLTYQSVPKPSYHAYRMLGQLGDQLLARSPGMVVTRDGSTGRLSALAFHYPQEVKQSVPASFTTRDVANATLATGTARTLLVHLTGVRPGAQFSVETLDKSHGNVMSAWEELGMPDPLTREQTAVLLTKANATKRETVQADANGVLQLDRPIEPWSLVFLHELNG